MKKVQQLISIAGLLFATIIVLSMAFIRYFQWENKVIADNVQIEIETEIDSEQIDIFETETMDGLATEKDNVYEFVKSDVSYFEDALFIGDSRSVGIKEYGTLEGTTFFVVEGMSIHNLWKTDTNVDGIGEISLEELLHTKDFGKVYIMLGYNELGYEQTYSANRYKEALDQIHQLEPEAIIYICSNLHVTQELSSSSELFCNQNINNYNEKLKEFADQETYFYLEVNTPFDDENGCLPEEYTGDDVHLYAKYYKMWSEWFLENTIQK